MAVDNVTRLAYAELVIYILLLPLFALLLSRHLRTWLLGWAFLVAFGGLRIASSALQIAKSRAAAEGKPTDDTAEIVNSVGVSALLLAISGIIHEASISPSTWRDRKSVKKKRELTRETERRASPAPTTRSSGR
jgi:hypothetical protein